MKKRRKEIWQRKNRRKSPRSTIICKGLETICEKKKGRRGRGLSPREERNVFGRNARRPPPKGRTIAIHTACKNWGVDDGKLRRTKLRPGGTMSLKLGAHKRPKSSVENLSLSRRHIREVVRSRKVRGGRVGTSTVRGKRSENQN